MAKESKKATLGRVATEQFDKLGAYFKLLRIVTTHVVGWLWGIISAPILGIGALICTSYVILAIILDVLLKAEGSFYYKLYEISSVGVYKYYYYTMAGIIKLGLDALAGTVKGIVEVALIAVKGVGTAMAAVVLAFSQGDGAVLSARTEMLQTLEQRIQQESQESSQKKVVEITYTEDQTYETERKEILRKYDKLADMLQYSFRFGKYWEQALATGIVREQQLENYHQMKTNTLATGMENTPDGQTLLQSVDTKAGQIKDVYYWRYEQALSEKEDIEDKIAYPEKTNKTQQELEEELKAVKEKLYGIYMEDNLYMALQQDGRDDYSKKVDYVMDLYYKDNEGLYSQIKEGIADMIEAEVENVDNMFNRFVGSKSGFVDMTIDEALNKMIQKSYGGYGYPKQYYTTKTDDSENVLGAQVYTYEESFVIAPEKLKLVKVTNETAPDGNRVSYMYFRSEDGGREYKVMGLEGISKFFNKEAYNGYKGFKDLKINDQKEIVELDGIVETPIISKSYEYDYVVIPEGTIIGYFGKNVMSMNEKEKLEQQLLNRPVSDLTDEEKTLLEKANNSNTYAYIYIELNEDDTNAIFDIEADFIIPKENKYYFRYALSKKEREGLYGRSRLYGGAVVADNKGSITKIEPGKVVVDSKSYDNLISYSESTQKLLNNIDPYWNSKYYVFVNGPDIEANKVIGYVKGQDGKTQRIETSGKSSYKVLDVKQANGVITEFTLVNLNSGNSKITYQVGPYSDSVVPTQITDIPDYIKNKLLSAMEKKITKKDVIGYALVQNASKAGIERQLVEVKLDANDEGVYDIEEAGRDSNGLLKVKLRNVDGSKDDNVKEYLALYEFGDKVKNKLDNVFNPNSSEYTYAYEKWDTTSYEIGDSSSTTTKTLASVKENGVVGFEGRKVEEVGENTGQYRFIDLGDDRTSIVSPEECILTKAGWNNENGWTIELTSLDYERRYTFSKLSCFSNWIQGVLGSKFGVSDYNTGSDWRTSGQYYEIDEYKIIERGEVIGKMGDSGSAPIADKEQGMIYGNPSTMPLVAQETLRIKKMGYKLFEIDESTTDLGDVTSYSSLEQNEDLVQQDGKLYVKRYYMDVENLTGTRSYQIEDLRNYKSAHTKIKGDIDDNVINLNDKLHKEIEYEKCYTANTITNQNIQGVEYVYDEEKENAPIINSAIIESESEEKTIIQIDVQAQSGIEKIELYNDDEFLSNLDLKEDKGKEYIYETYELNGNNAKANQIKVCSLNGISTTKMLNNRIELNTEDKEIVAYKLQPLYIYEGETIAYAKMKDTSDDHLLVTKLKANTNDVSELTLQLNVGLFNENKEVSSLLKDEITRAAKVTDLMAPLHVDVSIEKFDNLSLADFDAKYSGLVQKITNVQKQNDTIDVTYEVSNHKITKFECYNSLGELIGTNELAYTPDETMIQEIYYYNGNEEAKGVLKEKAGLNNEAQPIALGNCPIKANKIEDVAKIRAYDNINNYVDYNLLEIQNVTITTNEEQQQITVKVLMAQDDGVQKIEYYDDDKNLLYTKTVANKDKNTGVYSANIYTSVGKVSNIKVYSREGKVAYLKPEILGVSQDTNDNTISLSFVKGKDELRNIKYYVDYEGTKETIVNQEEQDAYNQSGEVTIKSAKLNTDGTYIAKVKVRDGDEVKLIKIFDNKGAYDTYKVLKVESASFVSDSNVKVNVTVDPIDSLKKVRYYDKDKKFILEKTIDSTSKSTFEIASQADAKYIEVYTKNGHVDSVEIK